LCVRLCAFFVKRRGPKEWGASKSKRMEKKESPSFEKRMEKK